METRILTPTKTFVLLAAMIGMWTACSKQDLPAASTGSPVFLFQGTIGADTVDYYAGKESIYMHTEFFKDSQDLFTLVGYFGKDTCTNCEPYLGFEFKDVEPSLTQNLSSTIFDLFTDNIFYSYSLDSVITSLTTEQFNFMAEGSPVGSSYLWDFGDGSFSTSSSPSHIYASPGIRNVKLKTTFQGASDSLSIPIDVTPYSTCRVQFDAVIDSMNPNLVNVTANSGFNTYAWIFGNGASGQGVTTSNLYTQNAVYQIDLTAGNSTLCSASFKRKINLSQNVNYPLPNFHYTTTNGITTMATERLNGGSCIITWKNMGKVYKSYKTLSSVNQSTVPVFTVKTINLYQNNVTGEKTVLISGSVNTTLYNVLDPNDTVQIKSSALSIAVAYP
ncbi:MAG: PKD domain-containing protein [Chitinophagaceae bacterium]|nr:PKD domain-containing protein [Chitinophagaceae bacterium]